MNAIDGGAVRVRFAVGEVVLFYECDGSCNHPLYKEQEQQSRSVLVCTVRGIDRHEVAGDRFLERRKTTLQSHPASVGSGAACP